MNEEVKEPVKLVVKETLTQVVGEKVSEVVGVLVAEDQGETVVEWVLDREGEVDPVDEDEKDWGFTTRRVQAKIKSCIQDMGRV